MFVALGPWSYSLSWWKYIVKEACSESWWPGNIMWGRLWGAVPVFLMA